MPRIWAEFLAMWMVIGFAYAFQYQRRLDLELRNWKFQLFPHGGHEEFIEKLKLTTFSLE